MAHGGKARSSRIRIPVACDQEALTEQLGEVYGRALNLYSEIMAIIAVNEGMLTGAEKVDLQYSANEVCSVFKRFERIILRRSQGHKTEVGAK